MAEKSLYQVVEKQAKKADISLTKDREKYDRMQISLMGPDAQKEETCSFLAKRFQDMDDSRPDDDWGLRLEQYNSDIVWREDGLANVNLPIEFATIRNKLADIQSSKTIVKLVPRERDDIYKRELMREIWDFVWTEGDTDKELSKLWLSTFIFGTGIWIEGLHKETYTRYVPETKESGEVVGAPKVQTKSWLRGKALDIRDVWIDPVQDIEEATDCFIRETDLSLDNIEGLKHDPNYNEEEIDRFLATVQSRAGNRSDRGHYVFQTREELEDVSETKYTLLHYYNRDKGVYIVCDDNFQFILREGVNPYPHGELPISILIDHPRPLELYGQGECKILENTKYERNSVRNQMLDHARQSNVINFAVGEGVSFEDSELVNGITRVWNYTGDISNAQYLRPPSQDSGLSNMDALFQTDATWITGVDNNALAGSETKTAFEARLQEQNKLKGVMVTMRNYDYFLTRMARQRLANIEFWLPQTTGRKIIGDAKLNKQNRVLAFQDKERVKVSGIGKGRKVEEKSFKLKDAPGHTEFLEITPKMIQSNLDIEVMTPTTTPILKELDRYDMNDVFNTIMQTAQTPAGQELLAKFDIKEWVTDSIERYGFDPGKYLKENKEVNEKEDLRSSILSQIPLPPKPKIEQVDQGQMERQFTQRLPQAPNNNLPA